MMPHMSGPELAEKLASKRPGMKVLCMSGYTDDSVFRHGGVDPILRLAYCEPRSLWKISPGGGRRCCTAVSSASQTSSAVIRSRRLQPTTFREKRSMITARYIQPWRVRRYVMSLTQTVFGRAAPKRCSSKFGATGSAWFESVVALYLRRLLGGQGNQGPSRLGLRDARLS